MVGCWKYPPGDAVQYATFKIFGNCFLRLLWPHLKFQETSTLKKKKKSCKVQLPMLGCWEYPPGGTVQYATFRSFDFDFLRLLWTFEVSENLNIEKKKNPVRCSSRCYGAGGVRLVVVDNTQLSKTSILLFCTCYALGGECIVRRV